MSILIVGTVAFDAIQTPFGKTDKIIGGAATYIGISSSYFSKNLNLVSVVGEDFPTSGIKLLKKHNICTKGLQIKKGEKTFFWSGRYHDNMNKRDTIETQLNVLETFNPIIPEEYKDSEYLMLGNLMPSVQQKVLSQMKKRPKLVVLDTMNFWMDNFMVDLKTSLKQVDILTINDEEARQLSGEYSLIKASKKILSMGPKFLIIKKGEHGAILFNNTDTFLCPAIPLEKVKDPTGAGDSFAGGLIGYLESTGDTSFENIKRAMIYGTITASFSVETFGTEKISSLKQEEINKRKELIKKITKFDI